METNRLVTIGALSEQTGVNIETIRRHQRIGICRASLPAARAGTGSTPKNVSGALWSSSDGHANWISPLRTCARFFGSLAIGTLTSIGRSMH